VAGGGASATGRRARTWSAVDLRATPSVSSGSPTTIRRPSTSLTGAQSSSEPSCAVPNRSRWRGGAVSEPGLSRALHPSQPTVDATSSARGGGRRVELESRGRTFHAVRSAWARA
jgi:hypothetical protein